jgi:hypothetical protein
MLSRYPVSDDRHRPRTTGCYVCSQMVRYLPIRKAIHQAAALSTNASAKSRQQALLTPSAK